MPSDMDCGKRRGQKEQDDRKEILELFPMGDMIERLARPAGRMILMLQVLQITPHNFFGHQISPVSPRIE